MHRILILLAVIAAAGGAASAYAENDSAFYNTTVSQYTTERIPGWLKISGEYRIRSEGRTAFGYREGNDDAYTLLRTRVNVAITPNSGLQFFFQGQDSRAPGLDPGRSRGIFYKPFDVRQAYVRIGNGRVKLTVGRQLLNYGAQRLLGPLDWTNTSRTWDAVKLELGTTDAKVDLFASSVVQFKPGGGVSHSVAGNNIHGAYGSFKKLVPSAVFEPYVLWKTGGRSVWTGGFRLAAAPGNAWLHGFDYQLELVRQWGTVGSVRQSAYAACGIVGYRIRRAPASLRLTAEYSYASGDRNPSAGTRTTFDHLLGTNHLFYGLTDTVGWQNLRNLRVGAEAKPNARLLLTSDFHWLWLDSPRDALYNVAGVAVVTPRQGNTARSIGTELDFTGVWTASAQWKIGGGLGHLFAGEFLKQNSPGSGSTFPYVFTQYSF